MAGRNLKLPAIPNKKMRQDIYCPDFSIFGSWVSYKLTINRIN